MVLQKSFVYAHLLLKKKCLIIISLLLNVDNSAVLLLFIHSFMYLFILYQISPQDYLIK